MPTTLMAVDDGEPILTIERLDGDSDIQLRKPDIIHGKAEALEQLRNNENRSATHLIRPRARHRHAHVEIEQSKSASSNQSRLYDNACRRLIGELADVAGGHAAAVNYRFQACKTLSRRVGAWAFFSIERDLPL